VLGHEIGRISKFKIIFAKHIGKPEGKRKRRRLGCRGDCNIKMNVNPLNAELNPICHLLALLGVHHFLHVSMLGLNH
jgi:hypothetical protein